MKRRKFITLLGGTAIAWPLAATAQHSTKVARIGFLGLARELSELAAQLVNMNVDLIFAYSSTEVEAARRATRTIPIVLAVHADPIGVGMWQACRGLGRTSPDFRIFSPSLPRSSWKS
jgi:hypothetical protein